MKDKPETTETKKKTIKKPSTRRRGKFYIDRKLLFIEVIKSKESDEMSPELTRMLMLLVSKFAASANFRGYTYIDDMQSYAILMLVRTWRSFNPEKSDNPFGFYTQCISHSFKQYLNQEKKHRNIRDALMVKNGLTPSFGYQLEQSAKFPTEEGDPNKNANNSSSNH